MKTLQQIAEEIREMVIYGASESDVIDVLAKWKAEIAAEAYDKGYDAAKVDNFFGFNGE